MLGENDVLYRTMPASLTMERTLCLDHIASLLRELKSKYLTWSFDSSEVDTKH